MVEVGKMRGGLLRLVPSVSPATSCCYYVVDFRHVAIYPALMNSAEGGAVTWISCAVSITNPGSQLGR